jgi:hypothetical protein
MGIGYPPNNKPNRLDKSPLQDDEDTSDSHRGDDIPDDVLSLLEENARLRGLVVKLSSLVLRNVVDQK